MVLCLLMEQLVEGRAKIEGDGERIVVEHLDPIVNIGETVKVTKHFQHEGKNMWTAVDFVIADYGVCPFGYSNSRGFEHTLIQIDRQKRIATGCASVMQMELALFSNRWLQQMEGLVQRGYVAKLLSRSG